MAVQTPSHPPFHLAPVPQTRVASAPCQHPAVGPQNWGEQPQKQLSSACPTPIPSTLCSRPSIVETTEKHLIRVSSRVTCSPPDGSRGSLVAPCRQADEARQRNLEISQPYHHNPNLQDSSPGRTQPGAAASSSTTGSRNPKVPRRHAHKPGAVPKSPSRPADAAPEPGVFGRFMQFCDQQAATVRHIRADDATQTTRWSPSQLSLRGVCRELLCRCAYRAVQPSCRRCDIK